MVPQPDPLIAWQVALTRLPANAPRRIGLHALQAGTVLAALALPLSLALMNIGIGLAALGALLARAPLYASPGFRWGVAFSACCVGSELAGWATSGRPPSHANLVYSWLALPLGLAAWSDPRARALAARALVIGLGAAAALALVQFLVGYDIGKRPLRVSLAGARLGTVSGFLGYNLTYGAVACLAGAALLGAWPTLGRGWLAAGRVAAALGVILSLARLALIGTVAALTVRLALAGGRWRRAALPVALALTLAGAALLQAFAPDKLSRLAAFEDGRRYIWSISVDIIADHPWAGMGGLKRFQAEYVRRWPDAFGWRDDLVVREPGVAHAHNSFLAIASQNGLPALVCHLGLLAALALAIRRRLAEDRDAAATAAAVLAAFVAAGLFNNLVGQGESAYATWLGLALALSARFPSSAVSPP